MTRELLERLLYSARHEGTGAGPATLAEVCEWALSAESRAREEALAAALSGVRETFENQTRAISKGSPPYTTAFLEAALAVNVAAAVRALTGEVP